MKDMKHQIYCTYECYTPLSVFAFRLVAFVQCSNYIPFFHPNSSWEMYCFICFGRLDFEPNWNEKKNGNHEKFIILDLVWNFKYFVLINYKFLWKFYLFIASFALQLNDMQDLKMLKLQLKYELSECVLPLVKFFFFVFIFRTK